MTANWINVVLYTLGWLLFVAAQAHNSVRSTANGLSGWAGLVRWLHLQAVNLTTRAFFCAILYAWLIQFVTLKIQATGLVLHAEAICGITGYASNALLYQAFGYLPFLRVEIQDLAPPSNSPTAILPTPPNSGVNS